MPTTPTLKTYVAGVIPSEMPADNDGGVPLNDGTADVAAGAAVVAFLPAGFGAVVFSLDDAWVKAESKLPLSLAGDVAKKLNPVPELTPGPHVVRAVACADIAEANAILATRTFNAANAVTVRFWVGARPRAFVLEAYKHGADAREDGSGKELRDGVEAPAGCAVVARPPADAGAVAFRLDGQNDPTHARIQSGDPYTFPNDAAGIVSGSSHLDAGPHTLEAWACRDVAAARRALDGAELPHTVVRFTCVEPPPPRRVGPPGWIRGADGEGYSVVPARADWIRVSNAGNNDNPGTEEKPVVTLRKAVALLRQDPGRRGILLRRGDVFDEPLRLADGLTATPDDPFIIAAYGPAEQPRPRIKGDVEDGQGINGWEWLVLQSLAFDPGEWANRGLDAKGGTGLWIEDCTWRHWARSVIIRKYKGWVFRRNVVADSFHKDANPTPENHDLAHPAIGFYTDNCNGFLWLEGNAFIQVGFKPGGFRSHFNQAVYTQEDCGRGLLAEGNLFAGVSSHGIQARPGGVIAFNIFSDCSTGLSLGLVNGQHEPCAGGVGGVVKRNYFANCRNQAIEIDNIKRMTIEQNAFRDLQVAINAHPSLSSVVVNGKRKKHPSVGIKQAILRGNRGAGGKLRRDEDLDPCNIDAEQNEFANASVEDFASDLVKRARGMGPGKFVDIRAEAERLTR